MDAGVVSIVISSISLIAAVSSTVVVSLINNRHQDKMFKKEFYEKRKYEVIENYLKAIGSIIFWNDSKNKSEISEWMSEIYMYTPKELWTDIDEMNHKVIEVKANNSSILEIKNTYIDFCKKFSFINREQAVKRTKRRQEKAE